MDHSFCVSAVCIGISMNDDDDTKLVFQYIEVVALWQGVQRFVGLIGRGMHAREPAPLGRMILGAILQYRYDNLLQTFSRWESK